MKTWLPDGDPKIIAESYGKTFLRQWFVNFENNDRIDFSLFGFSKNLWPTIVLPISRDLRVIAIKQFRPGAEKMVLEIPGGGPDLRHGDDSPIAVGYRELIEETGYEPDKIIQLSDHVFFDPSSSVAKYYPCLALGCHLIGKQNLDDSEQIEVVTFSLNEWLSMTLSGQVVDGKSVLITYMALPHILGVNYKDFIQKVLK